MGRGFKFAGRLVRRKEVSISMARAVATLSGG